MKWARTILAAGTLAGCALQAQAELADGIKAIVHDAIVTYEEVDSMTAPAADVLRRQYRGQEEVFQKKLTDALNDNLEQLIVRQLIIHDFKTAGYNLPESILDEAVQERIRSRYGDRVTLAKTLQAEGMTIEKFKEQIRDQIIVQALREKNISSEIIISPHKIETYYQAHHDGYKVEDQVKLRMIVLNKAPESAVPPAKQLAEEILAKIAEGASFADMAKVYSQGSQRKEGGDWGWVEKSVLRKELAEVAFALKPGEHSGVI